MQTLNAEEISPRIDLEEAIREINQLIGKIIQTISIIAEYTLQNIQLLQKHVLDFLKAIDIPALVGKIQDEINSIIEAGIISIEDIQRCMISEKNAVQELITNLQTSSSKCVENAYNSLASLRTTVSEVEQKGYRIITNAKSNIVSCIENNLIHPINAISCLWNETQVVVKELNDFVDLTNTAISKVQEITNQSIADLSSCANNIHQVMIDGETSVIKEFKICVGTNKFVSSRISNNLEDEIIKLSNQPQLDILKLHEWLSAVNDNIAQILKNVDLDKFKSDIDKKIQNILEALGLTLEQAESCISPASDKIQDLLSFVSQETKVCLRPIDDEIRELKDNVLHLSEEATQITEDVLNKLKLCKSQNNDCLETLFMDTKIRIVSFAKKIEENYINFQTVIKKSIFDFSKCLILTQFNTFDKERKIIQEFRLCVSNL